MSRNRRRNWFDRFVESWPGIVAILCIISGTFYAFSRVVVPNDEQSVVVYQSWATREIVRVEDLKGNILTNYDPEKLRYDGPIWVK